MTKTIHQIVDKDGHSATGATSAPGWFIDEHDLQVPGYAKATRGTGKLGWGPLFARAHAGNAVEFFATGSAYFESVARAISAATSSVFIAGWQINYDVELSGTKTLFHCLQDAMKNGATVYVMPWLAPPAIDTGYLATLMAVYHLNGAGLPGRAHCLPAPAQSDQQALNVAFAHHQKLVVVDNRKGYVGGIDLAYGRRDDANFSLKAEGRRLNEFYSACVPPIHTLTNVELQDCVTVAELVAAAFTRGGARSAATFATSPSEGVIARGLDAAGAVNENIKNAAGAVSDWWKNTNLLDDITGPMQDAVMDASQAASRWAWGRLDAGIRQRLLKLYDSGSANAANAGSALMAWLNGGDLSRLPPQMWAEVAHLVNAVTYGLVAATSAATAHKPQRYDRLFEKVKSVPSGASTRDSAVQPRMPWQDIQCAVEGPSVFDLSMNFVRRWNSVANMFDSSISRYRDEKVTKWLRSAGVVVPSQPKMPRVSAAHEPKRDVGRKGGNWVQVLRSAPARLLADETAALGAREATPAQNNCLKATLKAIHSSQNFLYIEGQFFQTAHGASGATDAALSGPMGALLDLKRSPGYRKFAQMLEVENVPLFDIPRRMRWAKVDDVMKEVNGPEFMSDLKGVLKNMATIEAFRLLGNPQNELQNPIGCALVNRIERAVLDGLPFHVYLVLPVHPEGTLDTLNIMTQVHLTMHSLVFGHHSLLNGVRRAVLVGRYMKEQRLTPGQAREMVNVIPLDRLEQLVGTAWQDYLTLLNLRNWDVLDGKPVTEQIYVHSKLLIADDRVAVLGSANINDRSMCGDRDSELAVIVTDEAQKWVKLDGVHSVPVAASVHKLRRDLWEKHFGLKSRNRRASALATDAVLEGAAAPATWRAIQKVAKRNADVYEEAFWFVPRSGARPEIQPKEATDKLPGPPPGSLWPTWRYKTYQDHEKGGALAYRMPFDPLFWRKPERGDAVSTWNVGKEASNAMAPTKAPSAADIQGYITALPINWTGRENNQSGLSLRVLAQIERLPGGVQVAGTPEPAAGSQPA